MPKLYRMAEVPTTEEYVAGFRAVAVSEVTLAILQVQYGSPERACRASRIACLAGLKHHGTVNAAYGRLGKRLAHAMGIERNHAGWWTVLSSGRSLGQGRWTWRMYPEVAKALELLGWVEVGTPIAEEVDTPELYVEGAAVNVPVNAFERNARARQACVDHHGYDCTVCGFNFARTYGPPGEHLIHVHHVVPLAAKGQTYVVDPAVDLRPVCANCHAIIHRRRPPYSIDEARALIRDRPS